ncbi:hypothetical protein D8674_021751 [Pyrus ussuriensis x Pyrus communis]|uniref:Pentatricopeptide repeat-containing protein n=1 Tax=Pyrus ussuriensis x Pyrus communis TaxID=2448454 RepID=A0A5N5GJZ3_9ROSA|nr:hypothetical protein D8674_021751 [Pyrus ussuriensis x Pyrus communis]
MSLPAYTATPIQLPQLPKQPPPLLPLLNPSQPTSPNPNHYRKHSVALERTKTAIEPTVSWTSSIFHRCRNGQLAEAVAHFIQMRQAGIEPNHVTFVTLLSGYYVTRIAVIAACADLGTLGLGLWINRFVMKQDFKDNVRITLDFFNLMQKEGFKPDGGVSFTGALTVCSHAGLVDEGLHYFDNMKRVHRITPRIEHYVLEDALSVIENMPMKPNEVVLGSWLAACRTIGNISLAERLMKDGANKLLSFELKLCGYVLENFVTESYEYTFATTCEAPKSVLSIYNFGSDFVHPCSTFANLFIYFSPDFFYSIQ